MGVRVRLPSAAPTKKPRKPCICKASGVLLFGRCGRLVVTWSLHPQKSGFSRENPALSGWGVPLQIRQRCRIWEAMAVCQIRRRLRISPGEALIQIRQCCRIWEPVPKLDTKQERDGCLTSGQLVPLLLVSYMGLMRCPWPSACSPGPGRQPQPPRPLPGPLRRCGRRY